MKVVEVAVGVVMRATQTFVCLRGSHQHQGGKWEFPGGKVDSGESVETALARELAEEIGIEVTSSIPLLVIEHTYPDKQVKLDVRIVSEFNGEPEGKEGQASQWVDIAELDSLVFPDANVAIIDALKAKFSIK